MSVVTAFVLVAALAGRGIRALLFEVAAGDAAHFRVRFRTYRRLVALTACCLPARRVTRIDPVVALRID